MKDNNLFRHSDKELVIDAFLCWLIKEMNDDDYSKLRSSFIRKFLGLDVSLIQTKNALEAKKQVNNVDVVCTLKTIECGEAIIIFENKRYSTAHSGQLSKYKEKYPDALK